MEPLQTAHLFLPLHQELLALLRGLAPDDWERPTVAAGWSVRDMAAHLLDTDLRRLSFQRDGLPPLAPPAPIASDRDLVALLDGLNAAWVAAARRLSPRVLIDSWSLIDETLQRSEEPKGATPCCRSRRCKKPFRRTYLPSTTSRRAY